MLFNPDPSKPAQELLFSREKKTQIHPTVSFNNIQVEIASHHNYLGVLLDEKLNFKQHVDTAILKINKGISVIKKLRHSLPQNSLITICKAFLRTLIDYGDIIYDQPQNESLCEKLESVQYKASLTITGAIQGTSRDKHQNKKHQNKHQNKKQQYTHFQLPNKLFQVLLFSFYPKWMVQYKP